MRILWKANAPWAPTGYGVQTNSLVPRLLTMPQVDEVGLFCYYGIQGAKTRQRVGIGEGITKKHWIDCYPMRADMWGNDVIHDHAADFKADVVITLMDIWVLADDYGNRGFRWLPYFPVDMEPIPPPVLNKAKNSWHPLVYSKFGRDQCLRYDLDAIYIPLGVETKIYKPWREHDRREAKELLMMDPDSFVVGIVGANKAFPPRKGFPELFQAFSEFHRRHPDTMLYLHSLVTGEFGGPDLLQMAEAYGIRQAMTFVDPYKLHIGIDTEMMNLVYNAMDVFCLPSMGEGFGVPLIEAQAAGVPVIATNYTSMPELVGAGWTIPYSSKIYTPLQSWHVIADVGACIDSLEEAYKMDRKTLSKNAREFALQYDWDRVVSEFWQPLIENMAEEIEERTYLRSV